jgi:hypothetical protein
VERSSKAKSNLQIIIYVLSELCTIQLQSLGQKVSFNARNMMLMSAMVSILSLIRLANAPYGDAFCDLDTAEKKAERSSQVQVLSEKTLSKGSFIRLLWNDERLRWLMFFFAHYH